MTIRKSIALTLSFIGVFTVAGDELLNFNSNSLLGIFLCVLAAVSYGMFTTLNQKWHYDNFISMMLSFFMTFVITAILNAVSKEALVLDGMQILGFAWNGFFVMALATVTWALALETGGTAKVSNLAYITPFLSLVWTFLILKEPIEILSVAGLIIIVVAIFIQLKDKNDLSK